ncbi:aldo/keto reductase [Autumnicola musiva]|uniref:Aldo/keto reductase n=1 Tax=Autumnicola musiva TaxID=3075589 RepID=A0ABU3D7E2_9FLAO|nr:aldo/keto reductase [Zunongwangia sp. F117]MDT0677452.1 aldo/keto reductase [Zunongwangia sp. F117]
MGTVQFGLPYGISNTEGKTSSEEVKKILDLASSNKIGILDTASAYGNAEEVIGRELIKDFKIVSKFMPPSAGERILEQLEQSLKRLHLSSLYAYLAHRPLELLEYPEQWDELRSFKSTGKVEKIGFSLNEPEELELLLNANFIPDLVQVPYNYFDRRFEAFFKDLKNNDCEIHSRSTFLQGLFFTKLNELDNFFEEVKPLLYQLQKQKDSLPGMLLKFVLENPFIDKVILGVESEQQLAQNLESIKGSFKMIELKQDISDKILIPSRWPKK